MWLVREAGAAHCCFCCIIFFREKRPKQVVSPWRILAGSEGILMAPGDPPAGAPAMCACLGPARRLPAGTGRGGGGRSNWNLLAIL